MVVDGFVVHRRHLTFCAKVRVQLQFSAVKLVGILNDGLDIASIHALSAVLNVSVALDALVLRQSLDRVQRRARENRTGRVQIIGPGISFGGKERVDGESLPFLHEGRVGVTHGQRAFVASDWVHPDYMHGSRRASWIVHVIECKAGLHVVGPAVQLVVVHDLPFGGELVEPRRTNSHLVDLSDQSLVISNALHVIGGIADPRCICARDRARRVPGILDGNVATEGLRYGNKKFTK